MKSTPAFVTVCILLACSVMLNVVVLLRPQEAAPRSARAASPAPAEARPVEIGRAHV